MKQGLSALLVAPPLVERTYPGKAMALDYLANALQQELWTTEIVDTDVVGTSYYSELLRSKEYDLIGITAMSIQVDQANSLARMARELAPNAVLVRGGAHDTYAYHESCSTYPTLYDALVVGEGEECLRSIATAIGQNSFFASRENIRGLAFWDGNVKFTGRPWPTDVNSNLPLRLIHHKRYDFDVFGHRKTAQIMGARGCENACFYCSESVDFHGRRELRRTIQSLRQEFSILKKEGYQAIYFDDPTFTRDRNWVFNVCDELSRWQFVWGCNTRVDCLDEQLIRRMTAAGCKYLFCGFESAAPEILKAMNKTADPSAYLESAIRSYASLRRNCIPCSSFLIFGCPRVERIDGKLTYMPETDRDVKTSLEFAVRTLDPDFISMNILRLLPGVPFSFAPQFACVRPTGELPVHGGHYDTLWYQLNDLPDLRSSHPIFRAFEGCGSVNPPHMTPQRCFEIVSLAVDMVNSKNSEIGKKQTKIVVDKRFQPFLKESFEKNCRRYTLASLSEIESSRAQCDLKQAVA